MEKFTETRMGKYAVETVKENFQAELNLLMLTNTSETYLEYISEKACDIYEEISQNNSNLNDIEIIELAQHRVTEEIKETITNFPEEK